MDLQITGEVIDILDEQSGEGKNGTWRKQEFILEVPGQYPKQICIVQWGDNIDKFGVKQGETITAHIDLQSREYNSRWYTDVKVWKVVRSGGDAAAPTTGSDEPWPDAPPASDKDDSLPF